MTGWRSGVPPAGEPGSGNSPLPPAWETIKPIYSTTGPMPKPTPIRPGPFTEPCPVCGSHFIHPDQK